jgi:hypothetical protein
MGERIEMKILWVSLVILIIGLAGAVPPPGTSTPTAKSIANAYATASAVSETDKDPFAVTWTSAFVIDNSKIDPVAISETAGYSLSCLEDTAFANSFSNAFAFTQGPTMAESITWTQDTSAVTDISATAMSDSHAEGTAY